MIVKKVMLLIISSVLYLNAQILDGTCLNNPPGWILPGNRLDWTVAGLLNKDVRSAGRVFNVTDPNYDDGDNSDFDGEIENAISDARLYNGISIIYFPTGEYEIEETIEITEVDGNNIIFQGDGNANTIIRFLGSKNDRIFYIHGAVDTDVNPIEIDNNITKQSKTISSTENLSALTEDSWVHYYELDFPLDDQLIFANSIGQINQIETAGEHLITLKYEAAKNYSTSNNIKIRRIEPIQNVGIENLKIIKDIDGENGQPNIEFAYAVGCWVRGIESHFTNSVHVNILYSSHIEISGCKILYSYYYTGGGNGYGINLYRSSTNCLIENNYLASLRHSILLSAGANSNVIAYNYTASHMTSYDLDYTPNDVVLHGRYPFSNLFEQNYVVNIVADNAHDVGNQDANGPYNAFLRNYCYDDAEEEWGTMSFFEAEHTAVLGCWISNLPEPPLSGTYNFEPDVYGVDAACIGWNHFVVDEFALRRALKLYDVSYYYSDVPSFVSAAGYTFPSIGPPTDIAITESIPARNATIPYNDKTTYWPTITSGTLGQDQVWHNGHTLTGDVIVPEDITLTIEAGASINLNGYSVRCTGSGIIKKYGTVSDEFIYATSGSNYKAFFPAGVSIAQALGYAESGWSVYANAGTYNENSNISVTTGRSLTLKQNVNINFSGIYRFIVNGSITCQGSSGNEVVIDGNDNTRPSYTYSMLDIQDGATANIEYTHFTGAPYTIIVRNSADADITNCTFTDFGFNGNSKALTIYYSTGNVNVNNCTFTGTSPNGTGIYSTNTGTNVSITDNTFTNCRYGIYCAASNAWLSTNTIQNSYYYGIYASGAGTSARYSSNEISGNSSSYGVYLNASSPYLFANEIVSNKVLINGGSPQFKDPNDPNDRGYNTIKSAAAPLIMVQNYAAPYFGYGSFGGYNSIFDTDFPHIYAINNSGVHADNNYWGAEGPINMADGTSWISNSNPLSTNPNLSKTSTDIPLVSFSVTPEEKADEALFKAALSSGLSADYVDAKTALAALINSTSTTRFPVLALLMYAYFTESELQDESSLRSADIVNAELNVFLDQFCEKDRENLLRPFALKLKTQSALTKHDFMTASSFNNLLISDYPNSVHELSALYSEISLMIEVYENPDQAKELLLRMDKAYPEEELTVMAHILLGENVSLSEFKLPKLAESNETVAIPTEFKMYTAQPNPFNPSTIIRYDLPQNTDVKLSVYNVNGQKISELVNGYKDAGAYQVRFDASGLSSGLYFYRLQAGKFLQVKRMLYIK